MLYLLHNPPKVNDLYFKFSNFFHVIKISDKRCTEELKIGIWIGLNEMLFSYHSQLDWVPLLSQALASLPLCHQDLNSAEDDKDLLSPFFEVASATQNVPLTKVSL